ncbi:MAG: class I tRNA ligase family protein, partial [Clostridia bacterium]|nr:class I tRNA ligase family protein [Clostridia bacterium]
MSKNVVIGIAWTYANSDIHLGHVCAYIPGDVLARYHRAVGDNVLMVSGTDCHGTPITERAQKENTTPDVIVNRYHQQFSQVFEKLGMSYDEYTLTATPYHHEKVQQMFKKLMDNGYLYPKTEDASFCPKCNKFIYDREVEVV